MRRFRCSFEGDTKVFYVLPFISVDWHTDGIKKELTKGAVRLWIGWGPWLTMFEWKD